MENNFLADKPVNTRNEDRFQRFEFSKRIAHSLLNRDKNDSLVIGIYGAWGEGKTSVLNFIESEIKESDDIIIVKFNPWRYTDEDTLLRNFLKKVSDELDKELKNRTEKIGDFVGKYGSIGSILNLDLSNIGKVLAEVNLEVLKSRVDGFLKESNKKLVVFIDDIDRLDKQEVYSVFRLVKLTGDFNNTTYILSFDEDMVASAIGERFGEGNKEAGINFLEKIIQVPLKIPKAQLSALKKYCFELVDKSINASNIELSEKEQMRFVKEFTSNILLRLNTPRLAVRYGNTLSFSFPLLKGEVNIVDLMLIEALKIFYPAHYNFVKQNSEYFINSYSDRNSYSGNEEKKKEAIEHINNLNKDLSKKEKFAVRELLIEIFPLLRSAYENYSYSDSSYERWYQEKRIVSQKYFDRYFSYSVLEGDISDITFENFIDNIQSYSDEDLEKNLKNLILSSSDDKTIQKLRGLEGQLEWHSSKPLILAISKNSTLFNDKTDSLFGSYTSPQAQAAIFIYKLLSKHSNKNEQISLAKELMSITPDINFAYELNNWFRYGESTEEKMFNTEQYHEIFDTLLRRALVEAGDVPIFEKYIENVRAIVYLLNTWAIVDRNALNEYIHSTLESKPDKTLVLLKSVTPTFVSSHRPEPYKASFRNEEYQFFKSSLNADYIYEKIKEIYGTELDEEPVFWGDFDIEQTDINLLRQYIHWYEQDHNGTEESVSN